MDHVNCVVFEEILLQHNLIASPGNSTLYKEHMPMKYKWT